MVEKLTLEPIRADSVRDDSREFGRTKHIEQIFGIKRGTLYNLFNDGKVKGKVLRVRGNVSGVRLWDVESVRGYIRSQMEDLAA